MRHVHFAVTYPPIQNPVEGGSLKKKAGVVKKETANSFRFQGSVHENMVLTNL